ncbi:MAG: HD domain-containing protein [Coprobacillaceae bacterium]
MNIIDIYHDEIPIFINELMRTKEMKRLKDVGMHCGCEYTNFPICRSLKKYSRFDHSVGVALIVWHFTKDMKQSIAGLLHDISTPTFAHVVDFLNNDYEKQESTEEKTYEMIINSNEIQCILHKYNITTEEVSDYHRYPIADNDAPKLAADRLEYTLGNFYSRNLKTKTEIKRIYDNIEVLTNEFGEWELGFTNLSIAEEFSILSLDNSRYYVADEDRFAMQYLSDILHQALEMKVITINDLYESETQVINLLKSKDIINQKWNTFINFTKIIRFDKKQDFYTVKINSKKRYINPLVINKRINELSITIKNEIASFLETEFNIWLSEESIVYHT